MIHSTPDYAHANGQVEVANKIIKHIIDRTVEDKPREWHLKLSKALPAFRTSKRCATRVTPFAVVYGHDVVLPMEITFNL